MASPRAEYRDQQVESPLIYHSVEYYNFSLPFNGLTGLYYCFNFMDILTIANKIWIFKFSYFNFVD
jgi:hypothetical protein